MSEYEETDSLTLAVAKAMCDGNWDAKNFNETSNGESPEEQREYWTDKALAAIKAYELHQAGLAATRGMPSAEEMMKTWNAFHDTLGGPIDDDDVKAMHKARGAFTDAANRYCAELDEAMRALDFP
jgi:hypothetical protein